VWPFSIPTDIAAAGTFHSELSGNGEAEKPEVQPDEQDGTINGFYLDIGALEKLASAAKIGVPCRIRRNNPLEKDTYFLLRADFLVGMSWDIIIPYPHTQASDNQSCASIDQDVQCRLPELVSWNESTDNDAGVTYFFVVSISGEGQYK
jgi:hypothetical protein